MRGEAPTHREGNTKVAPKGVEGGLKEGGELSARPREWAEDKIPKETGRKQRRHA